MANYLHQWCCAKNNYGKTFHNVASKQAASYFNYVGNDKLLVFDTKHRIHNNLRRKLMCSLVLKICFYLRNRCKKLNYIDVIHKLAPLMMPYESFIDSKYEKLTMHLALTQV